MRLLMGGGNSKPAAAATPKPDPEDTPKPPDVDKRLPFQQFRDLYTLKNYWKTIQRNEKLCKKIIFSKFVFSFYFGVNVGNTKIPK